MNVSLGLTTAAPAPHTTGAMPTAELPDDFCFSLAPPELPLTDWAEPASTLADTVLTATVTVADTITPDQPPLPDALLALIAGSAPIPATPLTAHNTTPPEPPLPAPAHSMPVLLAEKPMATASENILSTDRAPAASSDISFDLADFSVPPTATPVPVATHTHSALTASITAAPPITTPVGNAQWPEAVAESIVWSAGQSLQEAVIQLTPEDMGPLEIHIRIEDDITHVQFQAAHVLTREALQNALPQLAPLLAQQGLKLGDAQVGSQTPHGSHRQHPKSVHDKSGRTETAAVAPVRLRGRRGLVDDYV